MKGWRKEKVVYLEYRPEVGGPHAIGWTFTRDCGCAAIRGVRLDLNEPTFLALGCDEHKDEAKRALFVLGHMPASERDIFELYAELMEHELAESVTA